MPNSGKTPDSIAKVSQKEGEIVYFGIHDLSKYYREHKKLPELDLYDIFEKKGEIVKIDPIKHEAIIEVKKTPFQYGYRKLEYKNKNQNIEIKLPLHYLQDITHLTDGDIVVYLVIDGNTKYQKKLINAIRKNEIIKSKFKDLPKTRHYDNYEGGEYYINDDEEENEEHEEMHVAHFDPGILSKGHNWKMFTETKRYDYFPKQWD